MTDFSLKGFINFLIKEPFVMQQLGENEMQIEIKENFLVVSKIGIPREIHKHSGFEINGNRAIFNTSSNNLKKIIFERSEVNNIGGQRLYDVEFVYPGTSEKFKFYAHLLTT